MNAIDVDSDSSLNASGEKNSEGWDFDGDVQDGRASDQDYLGNDYGLDQRERETVEFGNDNNSVATHATSSADDRGKASGKSLTQISKEQLDAL